MVRGFFFLNKYILATHNQSQAVINFDGDWITIVFESFQIQIKSMKDLIRWFFP